MAEPPELPTGRIRVEEPPRLPSVEGASGVAMSAIPMVGSLGSVVLVASLGGGSSGVRILAAGLFLVATIAYLGLQVDRQRGQRRRLLLGARRSYLQHLAGVRAAVRDAADGQRRALLRRHPDPAALPALAAEGSRVWDRRPGDADYLQVRYGVRDQPLSAQLDEPAGLAADDADPAAVAAVRRLLTTHRVQPGLPCTVDLRETRRLSLPGAETGRTAARALVCAAATAHSPDHLAVAVLTTEDLLEEWEWVKWLPHAHSPVRADAVGPVRLVGTSGAALAELLADAPHLLLVVDGPGSAHPVLPPDGRAGATVVLVGGDGPGDGVDTEVDTEVVLDHGDLATAEAVARRLLAHRVPAEGPRAVAELRLPVEPDWRARSARDRLRVPIGAGDDGVVHLDLKESAAGGMGPHGLVVGATGSGKSELLRTLVLALVTTHPPDELNLVLVDFKGGATFAGMADLPHVSAVITNLAGELALVDRMQDALEGEMVRRQVALRAAGNLASVHDYARARSRGDDLAPLPTLLVVVDEFSELLSAKPELTELFVAIGRLGRSLGLHLLLASQRLEEGRLRGLESHLSYRIGLRTFSAQESRTVLGVPDAYQLPPVPGLGYLRPGPDELVRFRAAYVSGPAPTGPARRPVRRGPAVLPYVVRPVVLAARPAARPTAAVEAGPSVLDLVVDRLRGRGPAAHRIWLPPLGRPDALVDLLPAAGPLRFPVGTLDRPREQRRDPLVLDLGGAGGHVAVVGGPRSGKSTLLRTIVAATALTSSPRAVRWYVLDLAGALADLADLPHVAGVASRTEGDVVRRVVAEVRAIADSRESGQETGERDEVFVCVDGWGTLRAEHDELETALQQLAQRGLGLGVHLVVSAARWSDFRPALRDQLGTRLELRLGDPLDSEVDRRAAATVPADRPGRGLAAGPLHFLAARPPDDLVERARATWPGLVAPRLRLLPEVLDLDALRRAAPDTTGLLLGVDEARLAPVVLDPDADPHLLVLGEARSGKSDLLRTYLREVVRSRSAQRAQVVVVDYRRSLLGEVADEHLLHYLTSAERARPALDELASYLRSRLPGPDVTPDQLRTRSWWHGAEVFVVVDDYDLVAPPSGPSGSSGPTGSPIAALQPLLAQAGDVGLHLVLARRTGGASRALFEPVVQTLRDLAAPGVLLSGSPDEGPLVGGVRAVPAVPGRARLVTRERGTEVVQVAWVPR